MRQEAMGLSGCRYFSVARPLLVAVGGAANGAPHGSTITVTAQLTALTNSARTPHFPYPPVTPLE